jgi:hypothetical protein
MAMQDNMMANLEALGESGIQQEGTMEVMLPQHASTLQVGQE